MKYLFWLIIGLFIWWVWRRHAQGNTYQQPPAQSVSPSAPQDMAACLHCGVHLPQDDAVAGTLGAYCSVAHRSAAGDHNPC